jgi:single-strand DNA-binding protein
LNYNKAIVAGRVSQAPDLRSTSSGQPVATMGVATNRIWVDHDGTKHEEAQFHTVVIWGKLAETSAAFLTKGTTVLVEGRIETRSWEDKDGNTRKVTEIIAENIQFGARPATSAPAAAKPSAPKAAAVPSTEDLPVINLDGDEEDTGRSFTSAFADDAKVEDEDVPF